MGTWCIERSVCSRRDFRRRLPAGEVDCPRDRGGGLSRWRLDDGRGTEEEVIRNDDLGVVDADMAWLEGGGGRCSPRTSSELSEPAFVSDCVTNEPSSEGDGSAGGMEGDDLKAIASRRKMSMS